MQKKVDSSIKPNLFFSQEDIPCLKKKVESGWLKEAYEKMLEKADFLMDDKNNPFSDKTSPLKKSGYRYVEYMVVTLVLSGQLSDNDEYIDQAIKILFDFIDAGHPNYYIEMRNSLLIGDGGRALSTCYDVLYPYLTDKQKECIIKEITRIGTWIYEYNSTWGREHKGVQSCNHNSVTYGGLGLCALVLGEKDEWLDRAIYQVRAYFRESTDDTGYITEGASYSNYGLQGACTFAVALQRLKGIDLLLENEKTKLIPNQFINHLLPGYKEVLPVNDNPTNIGNASPLMLIISKFRDSMALYMYQKYLGMTGNGTYGEGCGGDMGSGLSLPLILIWADEKMQTIDPITANYPVSKRFACGRVFLRDKWEDDLATFVSFREGFDFHRGHNHNDQCSFSFYAKGEDFLIDPGQQLNLSESHNMVLVNGVGQSSASHGTIEKYEDLGRCVFVSGDATEAYDWDKLVVGFARRNILFVKGNSPYLVVVDDIQTEDDKVNEYASMLHTQVDNKIDFVEKDSILITGSKRGATSRIKFLNPTNLEMSETEFGDRKIDRYTGTYLYRNFVKEAVVKTKARNPHFISVVTSADCNEPHPEITYKGDHNNMEVCIRLSNGHEDHIVITEESIKLI